MISNTSQLICGVRIHVTVQVPCAPKDPAPEIVVLPTSGPITLGNGMFFGGNPGGPQVTESVDVLEDPQPENFVGTLSAVCAAEILESARRGAVEIHVDLRVGEIRCAIVNVKVRGNRAPISVLISLLALKNIMRADVIRRLDPLRIPAPNAFTTAKAPVHVAR